MSFSTRISSASTCSCAILKRSGRPGPIARPSTSSPSVRRGAGRVALAGLRSGLRVSRPRASRGDLGCGRSRGPPGFRGVESADPGGLVRPGRAVWPVSPRIDRESAPTLPRSPGQAGPPGSIFGRLAQRGRRGIQARCCPLSTRHRAGRRDRVRVPDGGRSGRERPGARRIAGHANIAGTVAESRGQGVGWRWRRGEGVSRIINTGIQKRKPDGMGFGRDPRGCPACRPRAEKLACPRANCKLNIP